MTTHQVTKLLHQILKDQATILNVLVSLMKNNDLTLKDIASISDRMHEIKDALGEQAE